MCGIIGIYNHPEASTLTYLGLHALQHRGQESAGIVTCDGKKWSAHHAMGYVGDIFTQKVLQGLAGQWAIGHVRYSTHGESHIKNCQPLILDCCHGRIAVAHNGNIVNASAIRAELEKDGAIFQSQTDTEVIVHLLARSKAPTFVEKLVEILPRFTGAFSLVIMTDQNIYAVRDRGGFRPLVVGQKKNTTVIASETTSFDLIGASFTCEVKPGEILSIGRAGMKSHFFMKDQTKKSHCIFEYIYFARPDSNIFGRDVYAIRKGFGSQLAVECPIDADVVVPVPDSGVPAAIGYSQKSGIPFEMALVRNHYVGRTFIEPEQSIRHFGVKLKLNPIRHVLKDKKVVLVDDSIVRGTTSRKIIRMIRDAGAKEVHVRISSPPTAWPCFYGIDTPSRSELIAAKKTEAEICKFIGADSLKYLSVDGLYWFDKQNKKEWFCDACFTGNYPDGAKEIGLKMKHEA
jgi:amidophosphoribosyltransferase